MTPLRKVVEGVARHHFSHGCYTPITPARQGDILYISTFVLLWQAKTAIAVDIIKDVDSNNCKIIIHVKNIVVLSIIGLSKAWH